MNVSMPENVPCRQAHPLNALGDMAHFLRNGVYILINDKDSRCVAHCSGVFLLSRDRDGKDYFKYGNKVPSNVSCC